MDPKQLKTIEDWKTCGLPLIKKSAYLKNPQQFIVTPDTSTLFGKHLRYLIAQDEYQDAISLLLSPDKQRILKNYYAPKMLVFSGGTETGNPTPMLLTPKQKFETLMAVLEIA